MKTFAELGSEFRTLICQSGYDKERLEKQFNVTSRTVQYWLKYSPPLYVVERLSLAAGVHPDWLGYKIREGFIYTSANDSVTKGEIDMVRWTTRSLYIESKRNVELEHAAQKVLALGRSSNLARHTDFEKLSRLLVG